MQNESISNLLKKKKSYIIQNTESHLSTQLHLAVECIKQQEHPIHIDKLKECLSFEITNNLLSLLKNIDKIRHNQENDTLEYVSLHKILTEDDLLLFLKKQTTFKGVSIDDLKDGWPSYLKVINDLEAKSKIIVLRSKKENLPKLVWFNSLPEVKSVDDEFKEIWFKIQIPEGNALYDELIKNNIKTSGKHPDLMKKRPLQQDKQKKKTRKRKITNIHMKKILKDYL